MGFFFVSQEGSQVKLRKRTPERTYTVIVPLHAELARGTLVSVLHQAGISLSQLREHL